jgi:hypothetical protein
MSIDKVPSMWYTINTVKERRKIMATIIKKNVLYLSQTDKTYFAFANLALAEVAECVSAMGCEIMNSETGEILTDADIRSAFNVLDALGDGTWVEVE